MVDDQLGVLLLDEHVGGVAAVPHDHRVLGQGVLLGFGPGVLGSDCELSPWIHLIVLEILVCATSFK